MFVSTHSPREISAITSPYVKSTVTTKAYVAQVFFLVHEKTEDAPIHHLHLDEILLWEIEMICYTT